MSILSETYDLARVLKKSPHRHALKSMLDSLTFTKVGERDTSKDRSQLGYFARHQHIQALGFLLLDKIQLPVSLPKISEEEKNLISAFHLQLASLDMQCVSSFVQKFPLIKNALNPYSEYGSFSVERQDDVVFFDSSQVNKLVDAFSAHPGIQSAIESMPDDFSKVNLDLYMNGVIQLKKRLQALGVHDSPRELMQIAFSQGVSDQNALMLRHLASIATIRTSLELLNQLLFQATQFDRLVILDEESVINILHNNIHVVGQGLTLMYQLNPGNLMIDPNDLVLVNGKIIDHEKVVLGWVQNTEISFSEESGNIGELSIRLVDENLNPFSGLVKK